MEVQCQSCKAFNRSTAQFCDQCGSPLPALGNSPAGQPESLFGRSFDESPQATSSPSQPINQIPAPGDGRPDSLPEVGAGGKPYTSMQSDPAPVAPSSSTAKPIGVAYEPGGVAGGGRPINLPEQSMAGPVRSTAPKYAASGNRIIGEVRELNHRQQKEGAYNKEIWSFRVIRYDAAGNRLQPVPVELKGERIDGSISDGDWVEIPKNWKPGEVVISDQVKNLTTGATLKGSITSASKIGNTCAMAIFIVFLLIAGSFVAWIVISILPEILGK